MTEYRQTAAWAPSKRTRWGALALGASLVVGGATTTDVRAETPARTVEPTLGALISGTHQYVGGTYVWTDYAYDDRGPDTDDQKGGDAAYPADMDPNNVGDLIQLQLAPAGEQLDVRVVLETLTPEAHPVVGIALDSDDAPGTGAAALPGSWTTPSSPLGVDRLFVLSHSGGEQHRWDGERWVVDQTTFAVTVDDAANTLDAALPFAVPATAPTLRAVAAAGYEVDGSSWVDGASPVQDLAFVTAPSPVIPYGEAVAAGASGFGGEGETNWQEYEQSAILGGRATDDPALAGAEVASIDLAKLRAGTTELAGIPGTGFSTFLYRSNLDLGEGVEQPRTANAVYNGPYQPYLVWAPGGARMKPGLPLVVYLHGASQTHLSGVNIAHYDAVAQENGRPDAIFDFDAVVTWPLGRGPQTWYEGAAERDPLDVADDLIRRLSLDADRVMLAGLSMGGYGTFRLAQHFPDRWSLAYTDVGTDDTRLPENLTALPVRMQNGLLDPVLPLAQIFDRNGTGPTEWVNTSSSEPTGWLSLHDAFEAAGTVDFRGWLLHTGSHAPAVAVAECVYRSSFATPRVKNPVHVRYTVEPATFHRDLGLVYDRAYWVSGIRTSGGRGSVDLQTAALGRRRTVGAVTHSTHENITAGADLCGTPDSTVQTRQTWSERARRITEVAAPVERRVTGTLTNLAAVGIAADRAGLGGRAPSTLVLTVLGSPVRLTLTGLAPGSAVTAAGTTARANGNGSATVLLPTGAEPVTVTVR